MSMAEEVVDKREEESNNGCKLDGGPVEVRVLVVDDSPVERRIVERLLKNCGALFHVIAVDSGKRAMEVLGLSEGKTDSPTSEDQKVDIILTDYCMPEMTGYDLLKAVKEQSSQKPIPVIIMSSENEPQRISRCRANGADDFIIKPLQTKDVMTLRKYARPSAAVSPRTGTKRKMTLELLSDNNASERRPRLAGLAVA
ncbi:two-component response regulator ORR1 [Canna indica]|uniref:Two-component response regulator ORR1 n=1 Tax=Canna indica TaxID=4628 RepID=A0AAQ3KTE4_9LILI|nr:two-component response regulator ORR1 [Canna indica]